MTTLEGPAAETPRFRRPPTMGDVAAHLGVSRQLVSLVLRGQPGASALTRERVLRAADELGYSPDIAAQTLRRKGSRYLGVLVTLEQGSSVEIVEQMHAAAAERGYHVVLAARSAYRDDRGAVDELLGYRCEALIMISSPLSRPNLQRLAERMPIVAVGHPRSTVGYDVVHSAGDVGIGLAVDHLHELGHRRIAYVDGRQMPDSALRRRGYRKAVERLGLSPDVLEIAGGYTEEAGARAAQQLLGRSDLPSAVVAANDHAALGLLGTLVRRGVSVPGDVSVTGYDDSRVARLSFADLTSVRQDPTELGRLAVECALSRIAGRQEAQEFRTPVSLSIRSSTAVFPAP